MPVFERYEGVVAPMDRADVDTDLIIPKQFLKRVERDGYGVYLFDSLRYMDEGDLSKDCAKRPLNKDFPLNHERYQGAGILLARDNFGCGSSREHAVWALADYGFRCVIAPSFADIFFNNCSKNGVLPAALKAEQVDALFEAMYASKEPYRLTVDLPAQTITTPEGESMSFEIDEARKQFLMKGWDDIGLTLDEHSGDIRAFERGYRERYPWLFGG